MEINIIVFIISLTLYPFVYLNSKYSKSPSGEKPMFLRSAIIQLLFSFSAILLIACYCYLLFTDWKLLLLSLGIIFAAGLMFGLINKQQYKGA